VRRAKNGDREAFERLVGETSREVYSLALRLMGNEHDARDVCQETYLRAFRSIDRFRGDAAITTWLYRIAANCAATQLSRRPAYDTSLGDEAALIEQRFEPAPDEAVASLDDRKRLVSALQSLPVNLRAVVVLHDVYDLSHEAIATELGISRAASKVRLHRARRRLRDALFGVASSSARLSGNGKSVEHKPNDATTSVTPLRAARYKVSAVDALGASSEGRKVRRVGAR
jgi:RNA polymerase sigma-70 factor (ECF subfamily)